MLALHSGHNDSFSLQCSATWFDIPQLIIFNPFVSTGQKPLIKVVTGEWLI